VAVVLLFAKGKEIRDLFLNVKAIRTGVLIASSLVTLAVLAQEAPGVAPTAAAVVAPTIHIPEGTEVPLLFVDPVSSATNAEGDRFTLRVDGDVKIGGRVAIKSGSIAVGTVTNAHKRGFMGKAGELNVNLDHVSVGDDRVRLRASKGKTGESKVGTTVALTILFGPVGLLKRGHDIDIKPGTPITAFVDQATDIVVPL
jgi:hypothetical protein